MGEIFSPWKMNRLTLPNRLVRSATWEGLADEQGMPGYDLILKTAELAEGGVGLVTTGYAYVSRQGMGLPKQTGVHIDACVGPLTRVSDAVHKSGGKVCLQIVHAGGQTKESWTGEQPVGPSAITHPAFGGQVAELSRDQIQEVVEDFASAAARARAAGFDAVQLHGAHGYLINQFLSPNINLRRDDYGGPLANRARFCYQVYQAVRDAVGPDFPVGIKLNSEDAVDGGFELEEALIVAAELSRLGMDAIEVSGGTPYAGKLSPSRLVKGPGDEGYFLANAAAVKKVVDCPVISVGGWRSPDRIARALDQVDAVALSRPFIREPFLAKRWAAGDTEAATCISCGKCFVAGMKEGLSCGVKDKDQSEG